MSSAIPVVIRQSSYHVRDYASNTNVMQEAGLITFVKANKEEEQLRRTLGGRVKLARGWRGLSQTALATASGVSQSTIGNIEAGIREKPRELLAIARALTANPEWLETGAGSWDLPTAPPPGAPPIDPKYLQLIADLEDLAPRKASGFIDMIHEAAEEARETAKHWAQKHPQPDRAFAAKKTAGRHTATVTWGDGNRRQQSLPLATVPDPFTAAPTDRESALYHKIARAPKEPKGEAAAAKRPIKRK